MDIYEAIYTTRFAMRRLKPDPIPYDVQARILDAAIHATPHRRRMAIHPGRRPGHQVAARRSTGKDLSA